LEALDDAFAARHLKDAAEVQMEVPTGDNRKLRGVPIGHLGIWMKKRNFMKC